jgi:hypothetical protein
MGNLALEHVAQLRLRQRGDGLALRLTYRLSSGQHDAERERAYQ